MKLPGWEKVTSAEHYRQMIEAEYHRLKEARAAMPGSGVGFEEVKLRLFLSLIEKPERGESVSSNDHSKGPVCEFPGVQSGVGALFDDDQPAPDQVA